MASRKELEIYPHQYNEVLARRQERRDADFLKNNLDKFPSGWAEKISKKHDEIKQYNYRNSNLYVLDVVENLQAAKLKISLNCHDSELIEIARERALFVEDMLNAELLALSDAGRNLGDIFSNETFYLLGGVCHDWGVDMPVGDIKDVMHRLICYRFWLRRLRVMHAQAVEGYALDVGAISRDGWLYISNDGLMRRHEQLKRGQDLMADVELKAEDGEVISLLDAYNAGQANPKNRVNELITRMKGFEELCKKNSHYCVFVTITCPSRMHSVGGKNDKYDGTKPSEAQRFMTKKWSLSRAKLARDGVDIYGLRVVEPHHDATPHWHMAVFYKNECDLALIEGAIKVHFLHADDADGFEEGAAENRLKFQKCDARGAVGYMLKYIVKNMRTFGIEGENSDESEEKSFDVVDRVEAWASTWRIRQFQFLGGHAVTTWRELRRVAAETVQDGSERLRQLWNACQRVGDKLADWAGYISEQGGLDVPQRKSAFTVAYELVEKVGRYGDVVVKKIIGVASRYSKEFAVTERKNWVRV